MRRRFLIPLFVCFSQGLCFDFSGQAKIGLFYFLQKRFNGWNYSVQFCFDDYADCSCQSYAESFCDFSGFVIVQNHYAVRGFESQRDPRLIRLCQSAIPKAAVCIYPSPLQFPPIREASRRIRRQSQALLHLPVNFMKQFEFADIRQNDKTTRIGNNRFRHWLRLLINPRREN